MRRSIKVKTPATLSIMTVAEAKTHLRIDHTYDDDYITALIEVATEYIQEYTNTFLLTTVIEQYSDTWEGSQYLLKSPYADIDSIGYFDSNNTFTIWAQTEYVISKYGAPVRVGLNQDKSYPTLANRLDAVKVAYTVGYSAADKIPKPLIQAAKLLVATYYENREETIIGKIASVVPNTVKRLLNTYKNQVIE